MNNKHYDSIIIGAGLTGLTTAHYLRRAGLRVLVLEKSDQPGGAIQTHTQDGPVNDANFPVSELSPHQRRQNGFVYESGPNTGVISSLELVKLIDELNLNFELPKHFVNARWIWKEGRWEPLPSGLWSAIRTPLFTLRDKFRILAEPFRRRGSNPDESLAELVIRRMGRSFLDYAIDPFISGIYAGDPLQLVTRYAMPKLYALEQDYGSFIRGSIAKARQPKSVDDRKVTKQVFSVKGGLSKLTDALVVSVGKENILCNCGDVVIHEPHDGVFTVKLNENATINPQEENDLVVNSFTASSVITTIGGPSLVRMLPFISTEEAASLNSLRYAGVIQLAVGYTKWQGIPIEAFGGLVPSVEKKDILGILFPSALFEGRAPAKGALLSVFMGGIKRPDLYELSDDRLKSIALDHIREMMKTDQQPDLLQLFRYPRAIPQYDAGSGSRLQTITALEFRYPGLLLAGNIRDGIGMSDRVKQGVNLAAETEEYLAMRKFI